MLPLVRDRGPASASDELAGRGGRRQVLADRGAARRRRPGDRPGARARAPLLRVLEAVMTTPATETVSAGAGRTFTDEAWERAAAIRAAVDELPFLRELEAGTLPREVFTGYLAQDALYLAEYGRSLAACAVQAPRPD